MQFFDGKNYFQPWRQTDRQTSNFLSAVFIAAMGRIIFNFVYCCRHIPCCLPRLSVEGETSVIMSHHLEWRKPRWSLLVIFFVFCCLLCCAVLRCAALCCAVLRWAALGWAHLISPLLAANGIFQMSVLNFNQILNFNQMLHHHHHVEPNFTVYQ